MSETDRELLEMAAMAYTDGNFFGFDDKGNALIDPVVYWPFNPLTDDGDALRLAVQLNIDIEIADYGTKAWTFNSECDVDVDVHVLELAKPCKSSATRRAIVRAAAEIWRGMR